MPELLQSREATLSQTGGGGWNLAIRVLIICGLLGIGVIALAWARCGRLHVLESNQGLSLCGKCAIEQQETFHRVCCMFMLPASPTLISTPVSRALTTNAVIPPHEHEWLPCPKRPNRAFWPLAYDDDVGFLVESAARLHQKQALSWMTREVFRGGTNVSSELLKLSLAFSKHAQFTSREDFQHWFEGNVKQADSPTRKSSSLF